MCLLHRLHILLNIFTLDQSGHRANPYSRWKQPVEEAASSYLHAYNLRYITRIPNLWIGIIRQSSTKLNVVLCRRDFRAYYGVNETKSDVYWFEKQVVNKVGDSNL